MLWDLNDDKCLYTLDHTDIVNALCFSPNRYWLCAATGPTIKIWDLESKDEIDKLEIGYAHVGKKKKAIPPFCTSLSWSPDGGILYSGYTDNVIRVWAVNAISS